MYLDIKDDFPVLNQDMGSKLGIYGYEMKIKASPTCRSPNNINLTVIMSILCISYNTSTVNVFFAHRRSPTAQMAKFMDQNISMEELFK